MNCTVVTPGEVVSCNGTLYQIEEAPLSYKDEWFWIYLSIYVVLVLFAGIISGLTLGLLSIDQTSLKVLLEAGTPSQQRNARRILPLVQRHHLLLVTLLLANAAAVESMPLFMDRISDPLTAILVSVTAVLFFGEVFPQAICSRYGLAIGATLAPITTQNTQDVREAARRNKTDCPAILFLLLPSASTFLHYYPRSTFTPPEQPQEYQYALAPGRTDKRPNAKNAGGLRFVYVLMAVTFIISWPIAKLLDCMLGEDHATFFRRAELKALVNLHGPEQSEEQSAESPLSYDEVLVIKGALEMRDKVVRDAMVPLDSVFMLEINARMDKATMSEVLRNAHSRIPVYEKSRENIIGVLLVKTLIMLDPDDAVSVRRIMQRQKCFRRSFYATATTPLFDLLNEFQKGKSHLALVTEVVTNSESFSIVEPSCANFSDDPPGKIIGIITMEDVIEELLLEEIVDETDVFVDVHKRVRVARAKTFLNRSESDAESAYTGFSGLSSRSVYGARTPGSRTPRHALSRAPSFLQTEIETTEYDEENVNVNATDNTPLLNKNGQKQSNA